MNKNDVQAAENFESDSTVKLGLQEGENRSLDFREDGQRF
jgi:hypothetical protein